MTAEALLRAANGARILEAVDIRVPSHDLLEAP